MVLIYPRTVKVRSSSGTVDEYVRSVRVVEAYRQGGKVKRRVVADLGRKDFLVEVLPKLRRLLAGGPTSRPAIWSQKLPLPISHPVRQMSNVLGQVARSQDGRVIARAQSQGGLVLHRDHDEELRRFRSEAAGLLGLKDQPTANER
jgi:hypothetical protein